jgi:hypothetical protein
VDGLGQLNDILTHPEVIRATGGAESLLYVNDAKYSADHLVCAYALPRPAPRVTVVPVWSVYTFHVCSCPFQFDLPLGMTACELRAALAERFDLPPDCRFPPSDLVNHMYQMAISMRPILRRIRWLRPGNI